MFQVTSWKQCRFSEKIYFGSILARRQIFHWWLVRLSMTWQTGQIDRGYMGADRECVGKSRQSDLVAWGRHKARSQREAKGRWTQAKHSQAVEDRDTWAGRDGFQRLAGQRVFRCGRLEARETRQTKTVRTESYIETKPDERVSVNRQTQRDPSRAVTQTELTEGRRNRGQVKQRYP